MPGGAVANLAIRSVAAMTLVAGLVLYGALLSRLRQFERAAPGGPPWWFGYARDGVNVLALLCLHLGFLIAGLDGPAALVAALTLASAAYVIDAVTGRWLGMRRAWAVTIGLTAPAAVGAALAADPLGRFLEHLLWVVAPR